MRLKFPASFFVGGFPYKHVIESDYEKSERKAVANYPIGENWQILELGAGLGVVTATAAYRTTGNVIAVEANSSLDGYAFELAKVNKLDNIIRVTACISCEDKTGEFHLHEDFLRSKCEPEIEIRHEYKKVEIEHISVNSLAEKYGEFDLIITDIEGAEVDVFNQYDFRNTKALIMELHPHLYQQDKVHQLCR